MFLGNSVERIAFDRSSGRTDHLLIAALDEPIITEEGQDHEAEGSRND
jgi:hypothetical protein